MTEVVFYVFAAAAVLGGAMCVLQRQPIASAMWLMSTMFSLACIYVLLGAQLIGILQILVYVGAILVLFLFVIMLLNLGREQASDLRGPSAVAAALVIVGLLVIELAALWHYTPARLAADLAGGSGQVDPRVAFPSAISSAAPVSSNVVRDVAVPLFETYLVPFEVTSILLLAAIIGAVVLAKRRI